MIPEPIVMATVGGMRCPVDARPGVEPKVVQLRRPEDVEVYERARLKRERKARLKLQNSFKTLAGRVRAWEKLHGRPFPWKDASEEQDRIEFEKVDPPIRMEPGRIIGTIDGPVQEMRPVEVTTSEPMKSVDMSIPPPTTWE